MSEEDRRKYLTDMFKYVKADSILIIDHEGKLQRLQCPFNAQVLEDVYPLLQGQIKAVIAVKVAQDLIDVYIIEDKAFYHYNFRIV